MLLFYDYDQRLTPAFWSRTNRSADVLVAHIHHGYHTERYERRTRRKSGEREGDEPGFIQRIQRADTAGHGCIHKTF